MASLALRGATRQWLTRLHRWSGLALLAFLVIAGATGTWLAFRHEIDRHINSDLRVVPIGRRPLTISDASAAVAARYPGAEITSVIFPESADESLGFYITPPKDEALSVNLVYVDPYTGRLLGGRDTAHLSLSKSSLDPLVLRLHYSLLLDRTGTLVMGAVAVIWLLTNVIGIALSWPRLWRQATSWLPILSIRSRGSSYKINYDAHRLIGVVLLPVLTVLAFTSIYLNLPELVRPAVAAVSSLPDRPLRSRLPRPAATVSFDVAVRQATSTVPDGRITSIYKSFSDSWYSVLLYRPGDRTLSGEHFVFVDLASGDVVATREPSTNTNGEAFLRWQFPLHTGQAFGTAGRILIALTGLCIVALSGTGFYVWWVKWRNRRRAQQRARVHAPSPVAGLHVELPGQAVLQANDVNVGQGVSPGR